MINKIVYYKETVDGHVLILWQERQRTVHCHNVELGPKWRVSIDAVPILAHSMSIHVQNFAQKF